MVGTAMGRPKSKATSKAEPERPPTKTVGMRSTVEWAEWLERGARHCRTDVAKLIDAAVMDYLKARGFDEPAPERMP